MSRACSHVTIPAEPAATGYRYIDLGGDRPPFYVRRFGFGDRSAAVVLAAPIEWSSRRRRRARRRRRWLAAS